MLYLNIYRSQFLQILYKKVRKLWSKCNFFRQVVNFIGNFFMLS